MLRRRDHYQGNQSYQQRGAREYQEFLNGLSKHCASAIEGAETEFAADRMEEVQEFVRQECDANKAVLSSLP